MGKVKNQSIQKRKGSECHETHEEVINFMLYTSLPHKDSLIQDISEKFNTYSGLEYHVPETLRFVATRMYGTTWAVITESDEHTEDVQGFCHFKISSQPTGDFKVSFARNRNKPYFNKSNAREMQSRRGNTSKNPGVSLRTLTSCKKRLLEMDIDFNDPNLCIYSVGISQPNVKHHFDAGGTIETLPDANFITSRIKMKEKILGRKGVHLLQGGAWFYEFTHGEVRNMLHAHGLLLVQRQEGQTLKHLDSIMRETFKATLVSTRSPLYKHLKSMGSKGESILRATSAVNRITSSPKHPYSHASQIAYQYVQNVTYITDGKQGVARAQKVYQQPTNPDVKYQIHDPAQKMYKMPRNGIPPRSNDFIPDSLNNFLTDTEMLAIAKDLNMEVNSPTEDSQWAVSYTDQPASWIIDQLFESFSVLFPQRYQEYINSMGGIPDDLSGLDDEPTTSSLTPEEKAEMRRAFQAELLNDDSNDTAPSITPEEKAEKKKAIQAQLFGDASKDTAYSPESSETAQEVQDDESPQGTSENLSDKGTGDMSIPMATPDNPLREGPPLWDWTQEPRHHLTEVAEYNGCPVTFSMSYGPLLCPPHLK